LVQGRSVVEGLPRTGAGLQVGAQLVHAVEGVQEEAPGGVDLHQGQVVQLQKKGRHREDGNTVNGVSL